MTIHLWPPLRTHPLFSSLLPLALTLKVPYLLATLQGNLRTHRGAHFILLEFITQVWLSVLVSGQLPPGNGLLTVFLPSACPWHYSLWELHTKGHGFLCFLLLISCVQAAFFLSSQSPTPLLSLPPATLPSPSQEITTLQKCQELELLKMLFI